jgi:hypothetical protein
MDLSLKTIFGMDGSGFRADLKQTMAETRAAVNQWANIVSGVAVAAVVGLSKGAIDLAGRLSDTSQNLGINVVSLQALEAQHKRNGVAQEGLTKGLEKTRAFQIDVIRGDEKALATLAALNIERGRFMSLPLDQAYASIAKATSTATDRAKAYNAAGEIFGEKIGPKMQASLRELGEIGLPGVTKAAREAGQVLDATTIAALDRAGDAIDDFKRKATVGIGSIIVNFRSEEGLKLLGMQFLRVVGTFGAGIADGITESAKFLWAVWSGAFVGLTNKFRDGLLDALTSVSSRINQFLPERFQINVAGLESLKSAGYDVATTIARAVAQTSPSTFKKDVAAYWDSAIKDQQAVVDQLNQVDLGKEADKLTNAGKDFEKSGKVAAAAIVTAGKEAAEELKAAAAIVGGLGRAGRAPEELEESQLQALLQNIKSALFRQRQGDQSVLGPEFGPQGYKSPQQYLLEQELARVQRELDLRRDFTRDKSFFGEGYVDSHYGASDVERLKSLAGLTSAQEQTNQKLDQLTRTIQERIPTDAFDDQQTLIALGGVASSVKSVADRLANPRP